ncbi:Hypothetical protein, putative [Bodo saltans]|uniref:Uncharacterized protein n=1 Tax=Bodo saltans TaxID=75058 RepID=A0A0S4JA32_BODSA|nr:Hypothetical protein, putative [Bodo saltans]|eukprot:CUG88201.1 Hypothetical protein, putative [Bodo saltans]
MSFPRRGSAESACLRAPPQTPSAGAPSFQLSLSGIVGQQNNARMLFSGADEDDAADQATQFHNFQDDYRQYLHYHHQSRASRSGGVQMAEGFSPSPHDQQQQHRYHQHHHHHGSNDVAVASSWCVTPQRQDRSVGQSSISASSSRRTGSQLNHTQAYASSSEDRLPPPAVAAAAAATVAGGADAHAFRGVFSSELSEDEDRTNVLPMDRWGRGSHDDDEDALLHEDHEDCPKTAPRAPKKPSSSSCARRKAAASARWCSVSGAQGLTLMSLPCLTDDESESLSQPTFERIVALHRPPLSSARDEDDELTCPLATHRRSRSQHHDSPETSGRGDVVQHQYQRPPPILQSAFDGLTLQSSPASKQLFFDDAMYGDDTDEDISPLTSRGSRHNDGHYYQPQYSVSRSRSSAGAAVMPTTDVVKNYHHYGRSFATTSSQRGGGSTQLGKTSARQRLLEQRRRRGRSDSHDEPINDASTAMPTSSTSQTTSVYQLAAPFASAAAAACVTPPTRYTVSCPLFCQPTSCEDSGVTAMQLLPPPTVPLVAASFGTVTKQGASWKVKGSPSDERPTQKPRLV